MTTDDTGNQSQDPSQAGASQEQVIQDNNQNNDPLDEIKDPEALRAEAKKFRAISNRKGGEKKEEPVKTTPPTPPAPPVGDFVTKKDLALQVTRDAKKLAPQEVRDFWDELTKIPLSGYDPMDAESIVKNMSDRLVILNARNPKKDEKVDITDLSSTKANGTAGGAQPNKASDKKEPPRFSMPKQPKDWYSTKA